MLVRLLRGILFGLDLLLGVTALWWLDTHPTLPPESLAGSPFSDYTLPAFALTVIGVGAAAGGLLVLVRAGWGLVLPPGSR
jgi:hypothetical protein